MRLSTIVSVLFGAAVSTYALTAPDHFPIEKRATLDEYIASEGPIALAGVLANIGTAGSKSQGAKAGVVIASPSKTDPDYVYTWARDSALVFKGLIDRYVAGRDTDRLPLIQQYVTSQSHLQNLDNPSGAANGLGLGEPKFNIDESAFTGGWGRPQRDGPALRATALITLANYLLSSNPSYVTGTLWPMITLDLRYVAAYWNTTGFDLWEEISSSSFFTTAVQHRSLREGIALAGKLGNSTDVSTWTTQASNVLCFLQSYWGGSSITANTGGGRSGLDANTILASVHTYSSNAGCDAATFQPCSDKALAGHKAVVDSFRGSLYPINSGIASNAGVAIGRYKEDSYYGGQPWYICTFAAAEQLYLAIQTWTTAQSITVTSISQPFFAQFVSGIAVGTYASTTTTYTTLISSVKTFADGFLAINQKYTPASGALSEQYRRDNGSQTSATDLTWSYASALTAFDRRAGILPPTWPAANLTVPATCSGGSGGGSTSAVTFIVNATTVFGENIYLTGSVSELANWSPDSALGPLSNPNYPLWQVTVNVPASTSIQYKYIRKYNGVVTWESDPNRSFTSPAAGGSVTLNDTWR
ncbi:glucoamylase [Auriculariales sp. MPI-PUGE-AT-0066]|nr:glucoamylase [Auriculariales sp. MPI-PUGE-AT-0066]